MPDNRRVITMPVTFETVNVLKNKDVTIKFRSQQEITVEEAAELFRNTNSPGWMIFAPNEGDLSDLEVPKDNAPIERGQKTPSIRLRSVLYALYMQRDGKPEDFQRFYEREMGHIIEQYKSQLDNDGKGY
jgi:hypothetical protein